MKKVALGPKPQSGRSPVSADEWVNASQRDAPEQPAGREAADAPAMKRLTIDIPEALHTQIKAQCALRKVKMADEIRALLEQRFAVEE